MNVNSFTIFGCHDVYAPAVGVNLRQHVTMYPGWAFWLHTDREIADIGYGAVIKKLAAEGLIRLTMVPERSDQLHTRHWLGIMQLWRMLPLWEDVEYVFCRDLDSILTPRQLQCVRSFMASKLTAHGICDNASHDIPLMGGMCGFRADAFHTATYFWGPSSLLETPRYPENRWRKHGTDQDWLTSVVWPRVEQSSLIHRLSGPNCRSHIKHVTAANIDDIPAEVRNSGDDFTNYIGACGCNISAEQIVQFYNDFGDRRACQEISRIEKEVGWEWPPLKETT